MIKHKKIIIGIALVITFLIGLNRMMTASSIRPGLTGEQVALAEENRKAISYLMNDLRRAAVSTIIDVPANGQKKSKITFVIDGDRAQTHYEVVDRQLIKIRANGKEVVAKHILRLTLRRFKQTPDLIEVSLKIGKEKGWFQRAFEINSNFKIKVRN